MRTSAGLLGLAALVGSPTAFASDTTTLPGTQLLAEGEVRYIASARLFGNQEDLAYFGLGVIFGAGENANYALLLDASRVQSFTRPGLGIRHGGRDLELQVRYKLADFDEFLLIGGISLPNTPSTNTPGLTGGVIYQVPLEDFDFRVGVRFLATTDTGLAGATFAAGIPLGEGLSLSAEATTIFAGNNTRNTTTGNAERRLVYAFALNYQASDRLSFEAGVTNSLGSTTGFALSSSLNSSPAIFIGVKFE